MNSLRVFHRNISDLSRVAQKGRQSLPRDTFGDLSNTGQKSLAVDIAEKYLPEEDEYKDSHYKEEFDLAPRKNAYFYKYEIPKYALKGKTGIRKALELFQEMKSVARLKPELNHFSTLIRGCAMAGYTKKAFELFEESLSCKSKPTSSTVTCLINACAESPFPDYGLKRLDWFLVHIKVNYNITMNLTQYNCAIKAYGKLGKLEKASELVKEMAGNNVLPDNQTFIALLIGAASNKESGASLALRLYKLMKYYQLKPLIGTYRILLRCIRDCGMGSQDLIKQVFAELPAMTSFDKKLLYKKLASKTRLSKSDLSRDFEWLPMISALPDSIAAAVKTSPETHEEMLRLASGNANEERKSPVPRISDDLAIFNDNSKLPNLLSDEHLELISRIEAIDFKKLDTPQARLLLFGGVHGFLEVMTENGCKPDAKTFCLLLGCIEHDEGNQRELFRLAKDDYKIECDLVFYDLMIRHVAGNKWNRFELIGYFLEQMQLDGIRPNISTFESIAESCETLEEAQRLLSEIESCDFKVSDVMLRKMMIKAIVRSDLKFICRMISEFKKRNTLPDKKILDLIVAHEAKVAHERGRSKLMHNPDSLERMEKIGKILRRWLGQTFVAEEDHPWQQFRPCDIKSSKHLDRG